MQEKLIKLLDNAHSPYSKVKVSALLKTSKGTFEGVNIENSAYPSGICAERSAIFSAVSQFGPQQDFQEIHVQSNLNHKLYPCAACLQVMTEFFTEETKIYIYGKKDEVIEHKLKELLPYAITKGSFGWK